MNKNARVPVAALAKKLKKPRTTIANRILSLEKQKIIKGYKLNLDFNKLGYNFTAYILMRVKRRKPEEGISNQVILARKILKDTSQNNQLPLIEDAKIITGPYDILLKIRVRKWEDLTNFLIVYLPKHGEIEHTETMMVLFDVADRNQIKI